MVPRNFRYHQRGNGLSYSSMPSNAWPTVCSVSSLKGSDRRTTITSHKQPKMTSKVMKATQILQKVGSESLNISVYLHLVYRLGPDPRSSLPHHQNVFCFLGCMPTSQCRKTSPT